MNANDRDEKDRGTQENEQTPQTDAAAAPARMGREIKIGVTILLTLLVILSVVLVRRLTTRSPIEVALAEQESQKERKTTDGDNDAQLEDDARTNEGEPSRTDNLPVLPAKENKQRQFGSGQATIVPANAASAVPTQPPAFDNPAPWSNVSGEPAAMDVAAKADATNQGVDPNQGVDANQATDAEQNGDLGQSADASQPTDVPPAEAASPPTAAPTFSMEASQPTDAQGGRFDAQASEPVATDLRNQPIASSAVPVEEIVESFPIAASPAPAPAQPTPPEKTYTVAADDSLFNIARSKLGKASRWAEIYDLNRAVLGMNFTYPKPGTLLVLPQEEARRLSRQTNQGFPRQ